MYLKIVPQMRCTRRKVKGMLKNCDEARREAKKNPSHDSAFLCTSEPNNTHTHTLDRKAVTEWNSELLTVQVRERIERKKPSTECSSSPLTILF